MLISRPDDILSSEITPERIFRQRRDFVRHMTLGAGAAMHPICGGQGIAVSVYFTASD